MVSMLGVAVQWLQPQWFFAIPLVVFAAWWTRHYFEKPVRQQIVLLHPSGAANLATQTSNKGLARHGWVLVALALCLIVVALARPQTAGDWIPEPAQGREFVLLVDTSQSMGIRDFDYDDKAVARIDVLKGVVSRFIKARQHDRFGVIAFASDAATLVPLTDDREFVIDMLQRLRIGMLGDDTSIGLAIALAVKQLSESGKHPPVLLVFSDGENTSGDITPRDALLLATENDAKIYTVAVTRAENEAGSKTGSQADMEPGLEDFARLTGGRSYQAGATNMLETVISDVDRLEKTVTPPAREREYHEWFWIPLVFAAIFLTLSRLLSLGAYRGA